MQAPPRSVSSTIDSTPIPQEDRRRHPRWVLSLAITMEGENNFYTGLSENISEAGVFIATHHVFPIGTPVVLSFTLPNSDVAILVVGKVQWVREPCAMAKAENVFGTCRDLASVKPGLGVQFTDMANEAADAIRAFMNRRSPEFFD